MGAAFQDSSATTTHPVIRSTWPTSNLQWRTAVTHATGRPPEHRVQRFPDGAGALERAANWRHSHMRSLAIIRTPPAKDKAQNPFRRSTANAGILSQGKNLRFLWDIPVASAN